MISGCAAEREIRSAISSASRSDLELLEQERELVAAEPGHGVHRAQHLAEAVGEYGEQEVTGGMSHRIVDLLEAVDVEEQHGERRPGPARAVERDGEAVAEQGAVGQRGERIVQGLMGELDLGALALDRVADGAHQQRRVELGLEQVVLGAGLDRGQAGLLVGPVGEDDDRHVGETLTRYKKLTAPFDGIVTQRNTDVGALISGGGGSGPAMFVISDVKRLRVYVDVPQSYVPGIKMGATAVITVPDYPNRTFQATVEASSQAVDVASGTTRMQLGLDNAGGELMPGGYAYVKLSLARDVAPLHIPASALIFDQKGLRVATVGPDDRVQFKTVTIARDLGRDIELGSGITADDRIITAPPDGLADGDPVRVIEAGKKADKPTAVLGR